MISRQMIDSVCLFCSLPHDRIVLANEHAVVIRDAYPVSPGHTLVIPRRHTGSFFDLSALERDAMLLMLDEAKRQLDASHGPEGFNIGVNDGAVAGQTVPHVHMHLIPRFVGDVADPRGGVRWVIPGKAKYWE